MKKEASLSALEALHLDQQLCFSLYSVSKALTQAYQPLLKPLGLTYPQYLTMLVLWEKDGISVSELGEKLYLDSGTLSPLLKKLEGRKLIRRQRRADDERTVVITLTSEGRALRDEAMPIPEKLFCNLNMDEKHFLELRSSLNQLRNSLNSSR